MTRTSVVWVIQQRSGFSRTKPLSVFGTHNIRLAFDVTSSLCSTFVHCGKLRGKVKFRELDCGGGCSDERRLATLLQVLVSGWRQPRNVDVATKFLAAAEANAIDLGLLPMVFGSFSFGRVLHHLGNAHVVAVSS